LSATAFSRWQASGTHLLVCVVIAAVVISVMLGVWYPGPLFEAAGGSELLYILVGVDVILGPLLTLIVFKSGKRGMKFDLTMIGLVQVAADMPTEPKEREKLIDAALSGLDLQHFPRYYVPYAQRTKEVLAQAVTVARLRAAEPVTARAVDAYLASSGTNEADVRALMLRTRFAWLAALIDPKTAQPLKMLLGEKIQ
jgi:hypothetical protein